MKHCRLAVALALLLATAAHAAAQQYFPSDSDLEVMLRYIVEDGPSPSVAEGGVSPGIVLGVVDADGHSRFVSYGDKASEASYATGAAHRLGAKSVLEIGSVGKAFTGVLLAEMVHTGEVSLDDPVAKYLPDSVRVPSLDGREITLLDLATHFSGLPFGPDNLKPANPADPWADYTTEKLYSFLSSYQLPREPGERFEYSNVGAALLGLALAQAAGTDFTSLLRKRILDPLGMHNTAFENPGGPLIARLVAGHGADGEPVAHWSVPEFMGGAGGEISTAEDLMLFLRVNLGLLNTDLLPAMRAAQEQQRLLTTRGGIALIWQVLHRNGRTVLFKGGQTGGFVTAVAFDPSRRVGYVLLRDTGAVTRADDLFLYLLFHGPSSSPTPVEIPDSILHRYVGTYQAGPGELIQVRQEDDGTMSVQGFGQVRFRMYPQSDTVFTVLPADWHLRFTRSADGGAEVLVLRTEGRDRVAPKIAARPVSDLPLKPGEMDRFEGTYDLKAGSNTQEMRIYTYEGHAYAQPRGQFAAALRNLGGGVFASASNRALRFVFTVDDDGTVRIAVLSNGRTTWTGTRRARR